MVKFSDSVHVLYALINSGAAGNFMDSETAQRLQIPLQELQQPLSIRAIDGEPIGEGLITSRT